MLWNITSICSSKGSHFYPLKKSSILDNIVEQSGKIIQYSLVDNQYIISDVYKNEDEYVSTVFTDLKISLKEIY